jgi:hypothetical protein
VSATLGRESGNTWRLTISGVLRRRDFDVVEEAAADAITRGGPIRLLVVLDEFAGWEPGMSWRDMGFYIRHGDSIERIAIVGDETWRSEALMFAGADLRKAAVEYFRSSEMARAASWLAASPAGSA